MNRKKLLWTIILLAGWGIGAQAQTHLYATPAGAGSANGLSWENAYTLQAALTNANNNTVIHLMVGEYTLTSEITIPNGVMVMGGYELTSAGTDTTHKLAPGYNSNWVNPTFCTILSGDYTHRIATVRGTLEGCVVRYGRTTGNGAGALIDGGKVTHCVLMNNMAYNTAETSQAKGGGAYVQNNGQLLNSVLCYNRADNGFGMAGTTGNIVNNTITQNYGTNCGTVADYDGNVYKTVVIGDQCWMRENLRTKHYSDGAEIVQGTSNTSDPRYYNPYTSEAETQVYGLLYNRTAAWRGTNSSTGSTENPSGLQGICPEGWHLPSPAEFDQMAAFLKYDANNLCGNNPDYIGKALASTEHWNTSTTSCAVGNDLASNNITLFTAQPAGVYDNNLGAFNYNCYFMTSARKESSTDYTYVRYLGYSERGLMSGDRHIYHGLSVRCVKDVETEGNGD